MADDTSTTLTRGAVRRLASLDVGRPAIASLYVDLDPSEFGTREARETAVNAAADELSKAADAQSQELDHDGRERLKADVERVRSYVTDTDLSETRALAAFAGPDDLFAAFHLQRGVTADASVGTAPEIGPLVAALPGESWGALLVDAERARFLRGDDRGFTEEGSLSDSLAGNSARDQNATQEEAHAHLRDVAAALADGLQRNPVEHLLLGGTPEVLSALRDELSQPVADAVRADISVEVPSATEGEVLEAAKPRIEEFEQRRLSDLFDQVQQGVATEGRASAGAEGVLQSLSEQRVEALLLGDGFAEPGVRCTECGWLGLAGVTECPADGSEVQRYEDIREPAIERALLQDADVIDAGDRPELGPHGGIAATLRF